MQLGWPSVESELTEEKREKSHWVEIEKEYVQDLTQGYLGPADDSVLHIKAVES